MNRESSTYDVVPYESKPFHVSHPDNLAVRACLHGMEPAPIDSSRVLELGCASGGNIIPLAVAHPKSTFVGLDLSGTDPGQDTICHLGLKNIDLQDRSLMDVDAGCGLFDYIICHGVYSWVPPEVQDKILAICRDNLAPHGVAYVSYNTYPGWHLRGLVRDVLNFHASHFDDVKVKIQQSKAMMHLLSQAFKNADHAYGTIFLAEVEDLRQQADSYLFHEFLEMNNAPVYFHEFAKRAAAMGLQYLDEADHFPLFSKLPAEVRNVLNHLGDNIVDREQYFDFIRAQPFRRTLLCHAARNLTRPPRPEAVMEFHVAAQVEPAAELKNVHTAEPLAFRSKNIRSLTANNPLTKKALLFLGSVWPRTVTFDELWREIHARFPMDDSLPGQTRADLCQAILELHQISVVELYRTAPRFVIEPGATPVAFSLARLQAGASPTVTNLRHRSVNLFPFDVLLIKLLDGRHDRRALVDAMSQKVLRDEFALELDGQAVQDASVLDDIMPGLVDEGLRRLGRQSLLHA